MDDISELVSSISSSAAAEDKARAQVWSTDFPTSVPVPTPTPVPVPTLTPMALSRRLTAALGAALTTMMADTALAFQPHVVFVMLDDWGYNVRIALNRTHRRVQRRVSGCHSPSRSRR